MVQFPRHRQPKSPVLRCLRKALKYPGAHHLPIFTVGAFKATKFLTGQFPPTTVRFLSGYKNINPIFDNHIYN